VTWAVPFYKHDLGAAELDSLARVLDGEILTTGATVAEFEARFAALLGRRHALGVTSCTGALHLALAGLGVGPGDEVVTTPMTFVATTLAILAAGATPVFADVEPDTGNLDADRVAAAITPRTRGILPVHLYGLMCDMRALRALADRHGLRLVEDAAHCIEGTRDGVRPGALSDAACFSFYATKNLACGEGGAVVTDDPALHERLRLLRLHGMSKSAADRQREGYQHWDVVTPGFKYNMSNVEAALLLPQFERLPAKLARREDLARTYAARLAPLPGLRLPATRPGCVHAHHLFPVWIDGGRRDALIAHLAAAGVPSVVNYRPVHLLTYFARRYGYRAGAFPAAEAIGDATLSLPFYPGMPAEHVERVADTVERFCCGRS
jgi:UDP-4-amino-4-deoxy-L-arabinose-oxoglutarate aminotransferase